MKEHINEADFRSWVDDTPVRYAATTISIKGMRCPLLFWVYINGRYRILLAGKTIYDGYNLSAAVKMYNDQL